MLTPGITAADLRAALGLQLYMGIFDDDRAGVVTVVDKSPGVAEVLEGANALVISRLPAVYYTIPDGADTAGVSSLLKTAIRLYAKYFAYSRDEEFAKHTGRTKDAVNCWNIAESIMDKVQAGILRIAPKDNPPEPKPRNVGGLVMASGQFVMATSPDGTINSGDF